MPIYEYRCHDCGHLTEELRSMASADEPVICDSCKSQDTSRVQSIFAAAPGSSPGRSSACPDMPPCQMGDGCCGGGPCGHH